MSREEMDLGCDSHIELCEASSGAIRFQVKSISGFAQLFLCGINPPHKDLFSICLSQHTRIVNADSPIVDAYETADTNFIDLRQQQEFWLTWYSGTIRIGLGDHMDPFIKYEHNSKEMIGHIKFIRNCASNHLIEWIYERSPIISRPQKLKKLKGGDLRWVTLVDHQLPPDAIIGGFDKEPLYIAVALHRDSMCPGKYVPSQRRAFVPWGGREHVKQDEFRILCGYNASWVQTSGAAIPQNAFIGGISEVRQEPLYIGRAVHDGNLINGKIHMLYHTCYLPYQGREIEVGSFEVLVLQDDDYRGILGNSLPHI